MAPRTDSTTAVFFDVDFTLIYPGPTFQGEGYRRFCEKHGISVDPMAFTRAVASAAALLDRERDEAIYDPQIFIDFTRHVIEGMGGSGGALDVCAREIYDEWAACHHFHLYEEVPAVLRDLRRRGLRIGLISNTHRSLAAFESHFELDGLISAAVSSSDHGYMKPHPSIFEAALRLIGVEPGVSVMVGDSLLQDVEGARGVGMRGVLLARDGSPEAIDGGIPVIRNLTELGAYL